VGQGRTQRVAFVLLPELATQSLAGHAPQCLDQGGLGSRHRNPESAIPRARDAVPGGAGGAGAAHVGELPRQHRGVRLERELLLLLYAAHEQGEGCVEPSSTHGKPGRPSTSTSVLPACVGNEGTL